MSDAPEPSINIDVVVTPDFNLAATMGFVDPFRAANYLDGRARFRWRFLSDGGRPCRASNGAELATLGLTAGYDTPDFVVISSSWTPERHATEPLLASLRRYARDGSTLVALDTGAFLLAQAGLLSGRQATTHYEHIDALGELYPDIDVREDLSVFDGNRISCCGGTATVDLALTIIGEMAGLSLANAAARYLFHPQVRGPGSSQRPTEREPIGAQIPKIVHDAIQIMEAHLEDPLSIPDICSRIGRSHRQLDRLFARHLGRTPALYYRDIRLDRARGLVTQTDMAMSQIAVASGFASQVHFSRAYRSRFGIPPTKDRIEGRVPFEFRAWPMHQGARRPRRKM